MTTSAGGVTACRNSSYSVVDSTRLASFRISADGSPSGMATAHTPGPLTRTTAGREDVRGSAVFPVGHVEHRLDEGADVPAFLRTQPRERGH